jgi:molybdate transport system regulatory protein
LELIAQEGSITAAGRKMGMSYRRAWLLVDTVNSMFITTAVIAQPGGHKGGHARLTPFGKKLISTYREIERKTHTASKHELDSMRRGLSDHRLLK